VVDGKRSVGTKSVASVYRPRTIALLTRGGIFQADIDERIC